MIGIHRPRIQRLATREGLGRVIALMGVRPSAVLALVMWSPVILVVPIAAIRLGLGYPPDWQAVLIALVISGILWAFVRSEGLAICEGGLLLGSFLRRPFRVRWPEVDPGTLAFVTPYAQVFQVFAPLGNAGMGPVVSSRRGQANGQCALTFAGPLMRQANLGNHYMGDDRPETGQGGILWCVGVGNSRVGRTRDALMTALTPLLADRGARLAHQLAHPIQLDRDPLVAATQIPGFDPDTYYGIGMLDALRRRRSGH